ncbi:uncharacterized protein LOC130191422 [Pseudoliparis swirei]|uniref:uncharacterized protein LOC130191422 n=1 Tax=Pseudoliparis swirei TaxID=2059687 RepID=UPI0024BE1FBF|nr:uncharacterized protein LOC130191422 [Pseudoliparis swirei]XP_056267055.1 uncharacterized protein LOC130191422 [Pseudoliparis swirei]
MGNRGSKPVPTGDMKYMEHYCPGSTIHCKTWHKKHGFTGKLEKASCIELLEKLRATAAGKTGKEREGWDKQMRMAKIWGEQAKKRAESQEREKQSTMVAAVSVDSDDETGASTSGSAAARRARRDRERQMREELDRKEREIARKEENARAERKKRGETTIDKHEERMAQTGESGMRSPVETRSVTAGKNLSLTPPVYPDVEQLKDDMHAQASAFPLVAVANPHYGLQMPGQADGILDREITVNVFHPWTEEQCRKACEGLTPYKRDAEIFCREHRALVDAFQLNVKSLGRFWEYLGTSGEE